MSKHIFKFFSPPGSHTILVFRYQTLRQYFNANPLTVASKAGRVGKNRDSRPIAYLAFGLMSGGVRSTISTVDRRVVYSI